MHFVHELGNSTLGTTQWDRISPGVFAQVPATGRGEGRAKSDVAHADEDMEKDLEEYKPRHRLRLENRGVKIQFSLRGCQGGRDV